MAEHRHLCRMRTEARQRSRAHVSLACELSHLIMHEAHLLKPRYLFFPFIHPLFSECKLLGIQNHSCLLNCALTLYQALCKALSASATTWAHFQSSLPHLLLQSLLWEAGPCSLDQFYERTTDDAFPTSCPQVPGVHPLGMGHQAY